MMSDKYTIIFNQFSWYRNFNLIVFEVEKLRYVGYFGCLYNDLVIRKENNDCLFLSD